MQDMHQTPTAMNPQTEFGEHLGFQQRRNHWLAPHLPPLHSGTFHGQHAWTTLGTCSAPQLSQHTGQGIAGCAPTPSSDFRANVTKLRLQTTAGISGDNAEHEDLTQSPEERQPPIPCPFLGTRCQMLIHQHAFTGLCMQMCMAGGWRYPKALHYLDPSSPQTAPMG